MSAERECFFLRCCCYTFCSAGGGAVDGPFVLIQCVALAVGGVLLDAWTLSLAFASSAHAAVSSNRN